jgi:hypothetical protein
LNQEMPLLLPMLLRAFHAVQEFYSFSFPPSIYFKILHFSSSFLVFHSFSKRTPHGIMHSDAFCPDILEKRVALINCVTITAYDGPS